MLHFSFIAEAKENAPLAPHAYLRLRREASGLSVKEAAAILAGDSHDVQRVASFIQRLETPGRTALYRSSVDYLRAAYPLDPAVYWQLVDEPPSRHPRVCRGCGCSTHDRCSPGDDTSCAWASPTRCTRCGRSKEGAR